MPILYKTRERRRLHAIDINKLKNLLKKEGYHLSNTKLDDSFLHMFNYITYHNNETKKSMRIGFNGFNRIFEICIAKEGDTWWNDIIPDYRKEFWKNVISDNIAPYEEWREKYRKKI